MSDKTHSVKTEPDFEGAFTSERKKDHIELALQSKILSDDLDGRFNYEPLLSGHPKPLADITFLGKKMKAPLWISSMTGGTKLAKKINHNLAQVCNEFGLGMGLGSCRILLEDDSYFEDFDLRPIIGDDSPFFANLGIAQVEQAVEGNTFREVVDLVNRLEADGLIIHVNPLQEWLQPEGDKIKIAPIETIKKLLDKVDFQVIVKEVGQGMGPQSLKALFQLPLAAIDFAAHGGTNFSKVELLRSPREKQELYNDFAQLGHSAEEMVIMTNEILEELGDLALCREVIVSGGLKSFLDGYYYINKVNCNSIYGQGSAFLTFAKESYDVLSHYVADQIKGLELATAYLKIR